MEKLIVIWSGDNTSHGITNIGVRSMKKITRELIPMAQGKKVNILCSPHRASESAEIVRAGLGVEKIEEKEVLLQQDCPDFSNAMEMIESYINQTDILILVVNYTYATFFPYYFTQEKFGLGTTELGYYVLNAGDAMVVDVREETVIRIDG